MTDAKKPNQNHTAWNMEPAKRYCKTLGLDWMEDHWRVAAPGLAQIGLTEYQAVSCAMTHAYLVNLLFSPQIMTWRQRLAVALLFLLGRRVFGLSTDIPAPPLTIKNL